MLLPKPKQRADQNNGQDDERVGPIGEKERHGCREQEDQDNRTPKLREQGIQGANILVWLEPGSREDRLALLGLLGMQTFRPRLQTSEEFIRRHRPIGSFVHRNASFDQARLSESPATAP